MKKTALTLSTLLLAVFMLVPLASADTINVTLDNPTQTGAPGSTLNFTATINAISDGLGPVFLLSDTSGITGTATIDDTPFFLNFPFEMNGGDSINDLLFSVLLPADITPGSYDGYFTIVTSLDPNASTGIENTVHFSVDAGSGSPVPEPATISLFLTGLGGLAVVGRRRLFS